MKPVLFVVSEVGYTWEEVISPFIEFEKQNISMVVSTPGGKLPKPDPLSVKIRPFLSNFGLGIHPSISPQSEAGARLTNLLNKPLLLKNIQPDDYSAIYIAGGHGALFDLNKNQTLHKLIVEFYQDHKPVGILCHASSTLVFIQDNNQPFLTGKTVTGFPTLWEYLVLWSHQIYPDFLPLPIWTQKELDRYPSGRNLKTRILEVINMHYVIESGNIISGVGPKTGGVIARKMIRLLKS